MALAHIPIEGSQTISPLSLALPNQVTEAAKNP
jgi:hypothetical protein